MKKLMIVLLAVVMCLNMCAMCASAETDMAYVGAWKVESVSMLGLSLNKEDLDWTAEIYIYENGDCFLLKDGMVATPLLMPYEGAYALGSGEIQWPLKLNSRGLLELEMTVEGLVMDLTFARSELPVESDAQCLSYVGKWQMKYVDMLGFQLTSEDLGGVYMDVYDTGYGILKMDGEPMGFQLINQDGQIWMRDSDGVLFPMAHMENGLVSFELAAEGLKMTFVMEPLAAN